MTNEITHKRRFSIEEDFMNYKTNDILYAFMRGLSSAMPKYDENNNMTWEEYLNVKNFNKNKDTIAEICKVCKRTIERNVNELIQKGLVKIEVIEVKEQNNKGKEIIKYIQVYKFPYDYDKNYEIIPLSMVKYLVNTRNANSIRIYIYLLNKYKWKADNYIFTLEELKTALGYSVKTKSIDVVINDILASLKREKIIDFIKFHDNKDVYKENKNCVIQVQKIRLLHVAKDISELENV